ncbi:MAG: hypothetical protein K2X77_33730 [Candidatus Obscuribacterales bacterium]|jgi:hypothetical protein|nr:hypothetical protein [Candidatus Obscuribacterales bacterium]
MQEATIAVLSREWAFREQRLGLVPERVFPLAIHEPIGADSESLQQLVLTGTYPSLQVVFGSVKQ